MSESMQDLAHLHRSLADHARRNQPLLQSLAIVGEEIEHRPLRRATQRMRAALETGSSAGEAWSAGAPEVPALYGALIEAASGSGELDAALDQIAEHAERSSNLAQSLRQALTGPVLTAVLCLVFGGLAAVVAGPALVQLTETTAGASPVPIAAIGAGILVLFVVLAIVVTRMRSPLARGRFGMPVVGALRLNTVRTDVAATLRLLLRRGLPLPRALALTAASVPEGPAREAVSRMHAEADGGAGVRESLASGGLYERSTLWLVESADGSDDVVDALEDLADVHRRRLERGIHRMGVVARPTAEIVVGIAVFFFAYSYAGPVIDMIERFAGP